jgi:hypothetical protein
VRSKRTDFTSACAGRESANAKAAHKNERRILSMKELFKCKAGIGQFLPGLQFEELYS